MKGSGGVVEVGVIKWVGTKWEEIRVEVFISDHEYLNWWGKRREVKVMG